MEGDAGCYYHSSSNDWDLNAVVRYACGGRVPPPPSSDDNPFSSFLPPPPPDVTDDGMTDEASLPLPDLPGPGSDDATVFNELFNAFFAQPAAAPPPPQPQQQPAAVATNERTPPQQQPAAAATKERTPQLQLQPGDVPPSMAQTTGRQASGGEGQRSKRKKKQVKKVVQRVAADGTTADPWAWRKYGQKPIKGSPYPRGYYRCSTDKACQARKMVERCRTDPDSFILTYTGGDHSHPVPIHRNSLAGTTRNRQLPSCPDAGQSAPATTATEAAAAEPSPGQSTSGGMSPTTSPRSPSMEEYHQEEDLDEAGASQLPKDVEMAGGEEDELLTSFLNPCYEPAMDVGDGSTRSYMATDEGGAGMSPMLNVVEETFVVTSWVTTALGDGGDSSGWS